MADFGFNVTISNGNSWTVRWLYHLYYQLINTGGFTLIDSAGDYTSEDDLATWANGANPWFVVESPTNWPGSTSKPQYFFGAKDDGYANTTVGIMTAPSSSNNFKGVGLSPWGGWSLLTHSWPEESDPQWQTTATADSSNEYTGPVYIEVIDNINISTIYVRSDGYTQGIHMGHFNSLSSIEKYNAIIAAASTNYGSSVSWLKYRQYNTNYASWVLTDHNHWQTAIVGLYATDFINSVIEAGLCQDLNTYAAIPALIGSFNYTGGSDDYYLDVYGYADGLYQVSDAIADYETVSGSNRIKLPGGFLIRYA